MKRTLTVLGVLLLTGCGLSEEKYASKIAEEACSLYEECDLLSYFGETYDACVTQMEAAALAYVQSEACDYDGGAAKECLSEWKDATCEGDTSTDGSESACNDVCGDAGTGDDS